MKITYKVIEIESLNSWYDNDSLLLICSRKGRGNTYIRVSPEQLRDFYFSGYKFNPKTKYRPTPFWIRIHALPFEDAISVEEQSSLDK